MLRKRISEIIPWHAGGQRAPNKPLMLLLAIADVQKGHEPLVSYRDIEPKLREALRIFGPVRKAHFPEYPFWHLKTDKVWRVISDSPIKLRKGSSNPSGAELRRKNARGGFLPEYVEELVLSADLQAQVIHEILDRHFPRSIHEDIVEFFELRMPNEPAETGESGHAFRNSVIEAYGGRCALSGFSARMGGSLLGVEAAHILWPQAGGTNIVANGIALSTLHRKLFHLGVFTVDFNYRVRISPLATGESGFESYLKRFDGAKIRLPDKKEFAPDVQAIKWHHREVFRAGTSNTFVEPLI